MPVNRNKVIDIVKSQSQQIEEPCGGYRGRVALLLDEILRLEGKHRVSTFDIQQKIDVEIDEVADFLSRQRREDEGA